MVCQIRLWVSEIERGQAKYSEAAITLLLSLRIVLKLPPRAMEGLAQSLVEMAGIDIDVPDYSTLSIKLRVICEKILSKLQKIMQSYSEIIKFSL